MGYSIFEKPDGKRVAFKIAGDKPTADEQSRIQNVLTQQSRPQEQQKEEPGIAELLLKTGPQRAWDSAQAGAYTLGQYLAEQGGTFAGYTPEQYAEFAAAERKERDERYQPEGFFEAEGVYGKARSLAATAGESIPATILGVGLTAGGAALGGPVGAGAGLLAATTAYTPQLLNENAEAQINEHGYIKDWNKAFLATGGSAAVEAVTDRITLGVAGVLTKPLSKLQKEAVEQGTKRAMTAAARVGGATAVSAVSGASEEVMQSVLTRWQAEQPLGDEEAQAQYLEAAVVGGILEGVFGAGAGTVGAYQQGSQEKAMKEAEDDMASEAAGLSQSLDNNVPAAEARRREVIEAAEPEFVPEDVKVSGALPDFSDQRTGVQTGIENVPSREDFVGPRQPDPKNQRTTFAKHKFTEDEYLNAVDTLRGEGLVSTNKIKKRLGISRPKARAIFEQMYERNDAVPAGAEGKYLQITVPQSLGTRQGSDRTGDSMGPSRDYIVGRVEKAGELPYYVEVNGKQRGKNTFATQEEATAWAQEAGLENYNVAQRERASGHAIYELSYRRTNAGEDELIGKRVVNTYNTEKEANDAVKEYDPAYSPESNKWKRRLTEQEKDRRLVEDTKNELGKHAQAIQKYVDTIAGPGRATVGVSSTIEGPEGIIVEGRTIRDGTTQLVQIAGDLMNGNPDAMNAVAAHEVVHVLRNAAVLTKPEWKSLEEKALREKVPGKSYTWAQRAKARGLSQDYPMEEAIAEMVRHYAVNPTDMEPKTRSMLGKIWDFIKSIGGLTKRHDADDVISAILGGEVGQRESGFGATRDEAPDVQVPIDSNVQQSSVVADRSSRIADRSGDANFDQTIKPMYSATAPTGQRVPMVAPMDKLADVEAKATYYNLSPVIGKVSKLFPTQYREGVKQGVDDTFIALQDKMLPLAKLIDRIKENGGYVTNENDTYLRDTLMPGQAEAEIEANDKTYYTPLMDAVKALPITSNDAKNARGINDKAESIVSEYGYKPKTALAELYIYAQHAQERNAVMRERNANVRSERAEQYDSGSGMSDVEAKQILDWFAAQPFGSKFSSETDPTSIRSRFRAVVENTNDVRVRGGLNPDFRTITRADGRPANMYRDYAPLRGFIEEHMHPDAEAEVWARTGQGYSIRGAEDRSALGRQSLAADLIANAIFQNQEAVVRTGKNGVGQSFLQLMRDNPDQMSEIAEIVETRPVKWGFDKKKGVLRRQSDVGFTNDPMVMVVKENTSPDGTKGNKETYIRFKDKRTAVAMKQGNGLGDNSLGMVVRALHYVNRFIGSMSTTYNPEFLFSNFFRDLQQALVNVSEHDAKDLHSKMVKSVAPAIRAVYKAQKNNDMSDPWAREFAEFRGQGAMTSIMGLTTLEDSIIKMQRHISEDHHGIPNKFKDAGKAAAAFAKPVVDVIENSNLAVENGLRLAAYKHLKEHFLSLTNDPSDPKNIQRAKDRAAFLAKELTVNFNRGGRAKPVLNSLYLFYNASFQGTMALINPLIRSKKVRAMWAGIIAAGIAQDMLMSAIGEEDDDGVLIYDKIPDYILEHNIIIPDLLGMSDRGYLKVPLPYLMNGVWNAGRTMSRYARGGYTGAEAIKSGSITLLESANPFGAFNSFANFVSPTVIDPIIDLGQNRDFANRPIAPPESQYGVGVVASQRYWNNTNPVYVSIADWLHKLSGGDGEYMPGLVEWSPNELQFMMEYALGGAGAFVNRVYNFSPLGEADVIGAIQNHEAISANDVPFLRRILGNVTTREDLGFYIENRDKVLRVRKELEDAAKIGDNNRYLYLMEEYPSEYKIAARVSQIEKQRLKISRMIKQIRESTVLSDEEKKDRVRTLKQQQEELVKLGNSVMRSVI